MNPTPAPQGLTVTCDTTWPRHLCAVCGTPAEKHGTYPTCATHPHTATSECEAVGVWASGKFLGLPCPGSACINGCVRAAPSPIQPAVGGAEALQKLADEVARVLPILLRAEDCGLWPEFSAGTGIATINGLVSALGNARAALGAKGKS